MLQLREESIEPTDEVLAQLLGDVHPVYQAFMAGASGEPLRLDHAWRYYRDAGAWLCRITYRKKTVSWMSIQDGNFRVTTYMSKKDLPGVEGLQVDQRLKAAFHETGTTRKYPYFMIDVSSMDQLEDLLAIMAFKKGSR